MFLFVLATAVAAPTVDELMALPDATARVDALRAVIASSDSPYDDITRAAAAAKVLEALAADERTDAALVRGFLEAALADDEHRRTAAIEAAEQGGLPPAPAPAQVLAIPAASHAPAAPPASLTQLRDYRDRMLYRGSKTVVSGYFYAGRYGGGGGVTSESQWTVYRGAQALTPITFAEVVGDEERHARLLKQRKSTLTTGWSLIVGGAVAGVAGIAMVGSDDDVSSGTGAVLALGGTTAMCVGLVFPLVQYRRDQWVSTAYDPDLATRYLNAYNDDLRLELGLSEDDVRDLELKEH